MKKPDCYYYGGGYCDKAAPFTPCESEGCVAYIDHKPMALAERKEECRRRAIDFAFNKFPFRYDAHGDVIDFEQTVLLQGVCRIGYMQAEKDLALTADDIYRIHVFLYAVKNNKQGAFTFQKLNDEQYQEVLDKFNEAKEYEQNKEAYTHWRESHRPKLP